MHELPARVVALAAAQAGVVSRRQLLAAGATENQLRSWLRCRLLAAHHPGVYVTHTGPVSWMQRAWAALLLAEPAVLHGVSVLELVEVVPRSSGPMHVAIDERRTVRAPVTVAVHRVRDYAERVQTHLSPPRTRVEDAVLDVAAEAADDHGAVAVVAAAVASRRTTPAQLRAHLARRSRIRRREFLARVLDDVAAGACSVLERAYLRDVERAHGLPTAGRQVRASLRGTVYRDVEYPAYGVIVELDGRLAHTDPADRDRDLDRDLDAAGAGRTTVRLGWGQVLGRACATAAVLARVLHRHGWHGQLRRCRRCPPAVPRRSHSVADVTSRP